MRKLAVAMSVATLSVAWIAPAAAVAPVHVAFPVSFEFQDDDLTEVCGFPVFVTVDGKFDATLHESGSGVSAFELDRQVVRWTVSAPTTGGSFSYSNVFAAIFDYPAGAVVGGPATIYVMGSLEHVPGGPATAGRLVFESTITSISPEGFPNAFLGEPSSVHGSQPGDDGPPCAALM